MTSVLIRLALPVAGISVFFLLSLATVRLLRPREPRRFFLLYALVLLGGTGVTYQALWPVVRVEDALALCACVLLQLLACLTMWNAFYSLLWGFSGSLIFDLYADDSLRQRERLIRSYERSGREDGVDRMLARRIPNLVRGGWVGWRDRTLRLTPKGRALARATLATFKLFSLGMGGGIK